MVILNLANYRFCAAYWMPMPKELSRIRGLLSLRKTLRAQIAKALQAVQRRAQKVDIIPELLGPGALTFAFAGFKHRLRNLGLWDAARDQIIREWFDERYKAEALRRQRAAAPQAQFSFPDFDALPSIRIA
jgi:hypothetical protein